MSRDDGFTIADVATDLFDDPKVKTLWRAIGDEQRMARAMSLYVATLLASWRHGCRVTVTESVPLWLALDDGLVAALIDAQLLDRGGRLKIRSWQAWFAPAKERRDRRREAGRRGGLAKAERRSSDALPDRPSDRTDLPTDRQSVKPSTARDPDMKERLDAWRKQGLPVDAA